MIFAIFRGNDDQPQQAGGLSRRGTLNPGAGDITAMRVEMWRTAARSCAVTLDAAARDWLAAKGRDPQAALISSPLIAERKPEGHPACR